MAETSVYEGTLDAIPDASSPGLLFLKHILPLLDSLKPESETVALTAVLAPGATFTINNGPTSTTEQVLPLFVVRAQKVASFSHELHRAWDVPKTGGRTVLYESTSTTVLSDDPEHQEIPIHEFNLMELVHASQADGGFAGLKASELRTYMDTTPIRLRAAALAAQSQPPQA